VWLGYSFHTPDECSQTWIEPLHKVQRINSYRKISKIIKASSYQNILSKKRNFTYFIVCFRGEEVTWWERYWCSNLGLTMESTSKYFFRRLHPARTVTLFTSGFDHWSRVDLYRGHFSCLFLHNRRISLSLTRKHNRVHSFDQTRTHKENVKIKEIRIQVCLEWMRQ